MTIIDASSDYKDGKNQNELEEKHVNKIVNAYDGFADVEKYMRIVPLSEIKENDYNLNISRYIDTSEPEPIVDLALVKKNIETLEAEEKEIDQKLAAFLKELGI